ncbi:adenylate/guanylate cyclase domain-containing protein [Nocardioides sp. CFH 31398]|uniref:adenylate/guanylate cyclase domain-containing protein n=1 Tax=Nocardioides sp. CFH 31398 TaxID=2919579 RepID=UPI001F060496|nr:adenylate/guanylate cyclase domain-containing protein [Nocardioides sp. CFH 31398]MCH1868023.1 adenylate/guanylate cyclase domain-containing protein [Nocardioides sp. CFH 31398]
MVDEGDADLLEGLEGAERDARRALVGRLREDGATEEEIREAHRQERLVLLPLTRALSPGAARHTLRDASRETGLPVDLLVRMRETIGLPAVDPDEVALAETDLDALRHAAQAVDGGIAGDAVLEINRVLARGMSDLAATMRLIAGTAYASPGTPESELAALLAFAVDDLVPLLVPVLEYSLRVHLLQQVTGDFVETHLQREGRLGQGRPLSVGFADLVGFTRFSEASQPDEIGLLSERLTATALDVAGGRVRVVKSIGDAVMVVGPTPSEVASVLLGLHEAAEREGLPPVRAAMAHGEVLQSAGDVLGRPVNLAARLTPHAEPGALVCDAAARDGLVDDGWDLAPGGSAGLRGIEQPQQWWTVTHRP